MYVDHGNSGDYDNDDVNSKLAPIGPWVVEGDLLVDHCLPLHLDLAGVVVVASAVHTVVKMGIETFVKKR